MICKIDGCNSSAAGKSKYCHVHRAESRKRFKEMLAQKSIEKGERDAKFQDLWNEACELGKQMAVGAQPQMISAVDAFTGQTFAPFPICGFAWVNVKPGNCAFANWLKRNGFGKTDSYTGGVCIWVHDYNQSYDLKYAFAKGMAKIFSEAGIKAYASGRLD